MRPVYVSRHGARNARRQYALARSSGDTSVARAWELRFEGRAGSGVALLALLLFCAGGGLSPVRDEKMEEEAEAGRRWRWEEKMKTRVKESHWKNEYVEDEMGPLESSPHLHCVAVWLAGGWTRGTQVTGLY